MVVVAIAIGDIVRPEEGSNGKLSFAGNVPLDGEAILSQQPVQGGLRHVFIVIFGVPWVVKGHLEVVVDQFLIWALHLLSFFLN